MWSKNFVNLRYDKNLYSMITTHDHCLLNAYTVLQKISSKLNSVKFIHTKEMTNLASILLCPISLQLVLIRVLVEIST